MEGKKRTRERLKEVKIHVLLFLLKERIVRPQNKQMEIEIKEGEETERVSMREGG